MSFYYVKFLYELHDSKRNNAIYFFLYRGARSIKNSLIKVHPNHTDVVIEFIVTKKYD